MLFVRIQYITVLDESIKTGMGLQVIHEMAQVNEADVLKRHIHLSF